MAGTGLTRLTGCLTAATLLAGCVTDREREVAPDARQIQTYLEDKPPELRRHFYVAQAQGQRNRVLNDMRLGLASFAMGRDRLAADLLDDALSNIEAIYADTEEARRARDLWVREQIKDFKGEPYERVMAYYYRGLLYMRAGDYENARASFKSGMLQDAFAEQETFRADFALMPFLQGWAAHCGGNLSLAAEDYKEFHAINESTPPPRDQDNVLVLVETGAAPVKQSDGPRLRIKRAGSTETARIGWNDPDHPREHGQNQTVLLEDIYRQASTRGGRPFDAVLEGKAEYKDAADTVGNVALVGAVLAAKVAVDSGAPPRGYDERRRRYSEDSSQRHQRESRRERSEDVQQGAAMAAGALALVGILSKVAAGAMEDKADTRYWDNLPDRVQGLTLTLPKSVTSLTVDILSAGGEQLSSKTVPVLRAGRCGLAWIKDASAIPRNPRAPNSAPPDVMTSPVVIPALPRSGPAELVTASPPPPSGPDAKETSP